MTCPPAVAGSARSRLAITSRARPVTFVFAVAVLLAGLGSRWSLDTIAVFVSRLPALSASTSTTMVIVADAPTASVPRLQITRFVQEPALVAIETRLVPAGSASTT